MTITLNGKACEVTEGTTLEELVSHLTGRSRGSAAAVDGEVVPRTSWPSWVLRPGQSVEMLTAVQGG